MREPSLHSRGSPAPPSQPWTHAPISLGVPAKYPSLFQHPNPTLPHTPSITPPSPCSLPRDHPASLVHHKKPAPPVLPLCPRPSQSPSPVPSLEWVSQGEPVLTVPDTCPAIRALLSYSPNPNSWPLLEPIPRASVLPTNQEKGGGVNSSKQRPMEQTKQNGVVPAVIKERKMSMIVNKKMTTLDNKMVGTPERKVAMATAPNSSLLVAVSQQSTFPPLSSLAAPPAHSLTPTKPLLSPVPPRPTASIKPTPSASPKPLDKLTSSQTEAISIPTPVMAKPLLATPKLALKPMMEILAEDSEEDDEVLSLTLEGVSLNQNLSFTSLITESPSPSMVLEEPAEGSRMFYLQEGEEDVSCQTQDGQCPPVRDEVEVDDDVNLTITNRSFSDLNHRDSLHHTGSACSVASSRSDYHSCPTSPDEKRNQKCTIA